MKDRDQYLDRIHALETNNNCHGIELVSGNSNPRLARRIGDILQHKPDYPISRFPEGERRAIIEVGLRRKGVFIIQPTSPPKVNARIMELFTMLDAARRESPDEITAVIPYFGYARQDRREQPGAPITGAVVAKLVQTAGAQRIITVDLHSEQMMGAVDCPWDNLYASYVLVPEIVQSGIDIENTVFASPDKGGLQRTIKYAEMSGGDKIALAYKQRDIDLSQRSKALFMLGDVKGRDVVITDDILATGNSLVDGAVMMERKGAKRIIAAVTHGLFLNDPDTGISAIDRIANSPIEKLYITDTIRQPKEVRKHPKIEVVSVDRLLADAIYHVHTGEHLFEEFCSRG